MAFQIVSFKVLGRIVGTGESKNKDPSNVASLKYQRNIIINLYNPINAIIYKLWIK